MERRSSSRKSIPSNVCKCSSPRYFRKILPSRQALAELLLPSTASRKKNSSTGKTGQRRTWLPRRNPVTAGRVMAIRVRGGSALRDGSEGERESLGRPSWRTAMAHLEEIHRDPSPDDDTPRAHKAASDHQGDKTNSRREPLPPWLRTALPRTIRRNQLRLLVPLADSTIYEMEQRGEFPRRFSLTSRCVVWDLAEVEAWIEQRKRDSYASRIRRAPSPDVHTRRTRPTAKATRSEK